MFHVKQKRVAFRCPAGACLLCRLPTMPLVYFLSPIPRPPSPPGKGEIFLFSYARGSAPCIPGVEPARHWLFSAVSVFFCPHPPDPLPGGKGGFLFYFAGGWRPRHPLRLSPDGIGFFVVSVLFAPIPPTPFPAGRGRPKLFHARGSAPCIPGPGLSPRGTGSIGGAGAPGTPCG